jgi:hypothetical protein
MWRSSGWGGSFAPFCIHRGELIVDFRCILTFPAFATSLCSWWWAGFLPWHRRFRDSSLVGRPSPWGLRSEGWLVFERVRPNGP